MRKYIFRSILPLVVVAFTSFSTPKAVCYYFIYISGVQRSKNNYSVQTSNPGTVTGTVRLYWIIICIFPSATLGNTIDDVTDQQFEAAFDAYDTDSDGTLDDENEISGQLEKQED